MWENLLSVRDMISRVKISQNKDIFSILSISIVEFLIILSNASFSIPRAVLGLFWIMYIPGYLILSILFPTEKSFRKSEEISLRIGLSIIFSSLVIISLNQFISIFGYFEIDEKTIAVTFFFLILILLLLTMSVRSQDITNFIENSDTTEVNHRPSNNTLNTILNFNSKRNIVSAIISIILIIIIINMLMNTSFNSNENDVEFSFTHSGRNISSSGIELNESIDVTFEITNHMSNDFNGNLSVFCNYVNESDNKQFSSLNWNATFSPRTFANLIIHVEPSEAINEILKIQVNQSGLLKFDFILTEIIRDGVDRSIYEINLLLSLILLVT